MNIERCEHCGEIIPDTSSPLDSADLREAARLMADLQNDPLTEDRVLALVINAIRAGRQMQQEDAR